MAGVPINLWAVRSSISGQIKTYANQTDACNEWYYARLGWAGFDPLENCVSITGPDLYSDVQNCPTLFDPGPPELWNCCNPGWILKNVGGPSSGTCVNTPNSWIAVSDSASAASPKLIQIGDNQTSVTPPSECVDPTASPSCGGVKRVVVGCNQPTATPTLTPTPTPTPVFYRLYGAVPGGFPGFNSSTEACDDLALASPPLSEVAWSLKPLNLLTVSDIIYEPNQPFPLSTPFGNAADDYYAFAGNDTNTGTKYWFLFNASNNSGTISVPGTCAEPPSPTATQTLTPTHTLTQTLTSTPTQTLTPTTTEPPTPTPTPTPTLTQTLPPTSTPTPSTTRTSTPTLTSSVTASLTVSATQTSTPAATQTSTPTPTSTPTLTPTLTASPTLTPTPTQTAFADPSVLNAGVYTPNESVWCVGRDLTVFSSGVWSVYDWTNSAVPSNAPWYLDTRSISIDADDVKWVGCAVSSATSQVLVFAVEGPDAARGSSWELNEFGLGSPDWEVPLVYASPYGQEVIAVISPLNGGAATGATCSPGATGGFLWNYNKITQKWQEVSPGYTWPTIHDIKAKGEDGKIWFYYLATDDGLQIINSGTLIPSVLQDGTVYLPELKKLNKFNSSLNSEKVYSIDFDENGNYWLGTEVGLSYWDGQKFYNWAVPVALPVTKVIARPYGHVFFRCGNPQSNPPTTNGFYHFNGVNFTHFDSSNSDLPSDVIIDFDVATTKSIENGITTYPNDLWIISGNNIVLFDYVLPHVYGSSLYEGTTGWNFLYYTPSPTGATSDQALLPKVQKYNWVYPSWQGYDNADLALSHPGMDPRNLFLTANFKDIANGEAGNQNYWNWGQTPTYEQQVQAQSIPDYSWMIGITSSSPLLFTDPYVVVTSTTRFAGLNVVTGYLNGKTVNFGPSSNTEQEYIFENPNLTVGIGGQDDVGFVAFYTDKGQVQGVIPFRGETTRILDAKPSYDGKSLIVAGKFTYYLEAGKFVWNTRFPNSASLTITGVTGPTGGPVGFSNLETPGITGTFDYPWILNSPISGSGVYIPDSSLIYDNPSYFIAEVDFELGDQTSYGGIDFSTQSLESRFNLKRFRYFPSLDSSFNPEPGPSGFFPSGIGVSGGTELAVSQNSIRLMSNFIGGYSTLKNTYLYTNDFPSAPDFFFSPIENNIYKPSSFVLELNPDFSLVNARVIGITGSNSFSDSLVSLPNGQTFLTTGTSTHDVKFGGMVIPHPNIGFSYPWVLLSNSNFVGITGTFIRNYEINDPNYHLGWHKTIRAFGSSATYYTAYLFTGDATIQSSSGSNVTVTGVSGALQAGILSVSPGGKIQSESSFEILPSTYEDVYTTQITEVDGIRGKEDYYLSVNYPLQPGTTGSGNLILKRSVTGTFVDSFSTFGPGLTGTQNELFFTVSPDLNIFISGTNQGLTGPTGLPYPASNFSPFVSFLESYKPPIGIDLGNIISRAGSGAWTWVDVHNSNNNLYVPMLSTVFFSNYDSQIFGKRNNRWVLSNARTGEVILDVKFTPYFIYTFTESDYYSIQNTVEDSAGNIYEISKPAFITVVNQSIPKANDPNPLLVNSADYGFIPPNKDFQSEAADLDRSILEQQIFIRSQNVPDFGSGLNIKSDENSTFRET